MSMTAEIEDGEDVSSAVIKLEGVISSHVKTFKNCEIGYSRFLNLKYDRDLLENEVLGLEKRKSDVENWAKKYNVSLNAVGDLPF
jgi:hypothetical protein